MTQTPAAVEPGVPVTTRAPGEPTVTPPAGHLRFPLVDALRAIAALLIFGYHVAYVSGTLTYGWASKITGHLNVGVPIFFVISGFVLYRPFVASRFGAPPRSIGRYARNRVLRIAPAYWVALTLAAVYPGLTGVFTGDWLWYYGFGQIYTKQRELLGLPVAWSLCVEVTFYALLPLYAVLARRFIGRRPGWVRLELASLAALCIVLTALHAAPALLPLTTIISTFDWFAIGMALAVISVARPGRLTRALADRPTASWALALAAYVAFCYALTPISDGLRLGTWALLTLVTVWSGVIAGLVALPAVMPSEQTGLPQRVLRLPALAWLGLVSYGLYLYHLPVLVGIGRLGYQDVIPGQVVLSYVALAAPATVALAAASYYVIERPALRFKFTGPRRGRRARARRQDVRASA
jgi:peptidoglycan/LPS O-acetylase OafA/YrhL